MAATTNPGSSSPSSENANAARPHPRDALGPTARKILDAAQRLLAEKGFTSVTLENVAAEAGVNKASIRYSFGNKAGLVEALVDALMAEEFELASQLLSTTEHADRLHGAILAKRRMVLRAEEFRGFFDILPHAMRTRELRDRISGLYPWWCDQNLRLLGLEGQGAEGRAELLTHLGLLICAVVDGLSIQEGLDPDGFDPDGPLAALEFLLQQSMPMLDDLAGQGSSQE